jgi:hypothetical protein
MDNLPDATVQTAVDEVNRHGYDPDFRPFSSPYDKCLCGEMVENVPESWNAHVAVAVMTATAPLIVALELRRLADEIRAEAADPTNNWAPNEAYRAQKIFTKIRAYADELQPTDEWQPMGTAPHDGTPIVVTYGPGETAKVQWADERRCMLADVAPGAGTAGPGWEDADNHLTLDDEPQGWKAISASMHPSPSGVPLLRTEPETD